MLGLFTQLNAMKRQLTSLAAVNLELAKLEGKQKATHWGLPAGSGRGPLCSWSSQSGSLLRPPQPGWRRPSHSGSRYSSSQL